jgi:hypothetical protein
MSVRLQSAPTMTNVLARAFAVMPFFFSIGCTIGPTLGGMLANPSQLNWPLLTYYPFLLPNLVCAAMVGLTMLLASIALKETHPVKDESTLPLLPPHPESFTCLDMKVWKPIVAVCLLSGHTVTYIQLLPIFLRDPRDTTVPPYYVGGIGGLEMSLSSVGLVMGVNGIIGLVVQLMFPFFTECVGINATLLIMSTLHPLSYFCLPYLAFVPDNIWRYVGLYTWLTMRNVFSTFTYPILLIYIKRWTPNSMLGRVNGFVASAGAGCRSISPAGAGFLQSIGQNHHLSALAWWASGLIALIAAILTWFIDIPSDG